MSPEIAEARTEAALGDFSEVFVGDVFAPNTVVETIWTPEPSFEQMKDLYCNKPLFTIARLPLEEELTTEDKEDIKNALESHKEPGSTKLDDFKKELGL